MSDSLLPAAVPSPARAWVSRAGAVAVIVLGAQFLWRAIILGRGYFSQDDFLAMSESAGRDGWSVLTGDYASGFSPGGSLVVRLFVETAPLQWGPAAGIVLILQAAATAMLWLVLTHIMGDRWLRVPLLVVFAFSPLTLWSTQWWVLGVALWSATLFLLVAIWAALSAERTGDRRREVLAVLAIGLALAFDERAVVYPVLVFGALLIVSDQLSVGSRVSKVIAERLLLWIALVLLIGGYAVLRWQVAPITLDFGNELGEVVTDYLRHGIVEAFGGPWTGSVPSHAYLIPESWAVALSGLILLALVGLTKQHGGVSARVSWATLIAYVLGSIGVLACTGRAEVLASLGLVHRFGAELAVVLALALAGAVRQVELPDLTASARWLTPLELERSLAAASAAALTASAAISTAFLASNLYHSDDRSYVEAVRAGLRADPQVVLLDGGVPAGIISSWYGARASVSRVIGTAPEKPVFDLPSHSLRMVREDGTLAPVILEGAVDAESTADQACGYPVRAEGTLIPMQGEVPEGRWVLKIGYYTNVDAFATIQVAGGQQRFAVRSGLQSVDVVVNGGFVNFRMTLDKADATLCLTDASAGVPRAEAR